MEKQEKGAGSAYQLREKYDGEHLQAEFSINIPEGHDLDAALHEFAQMSRRFYLKAAEDFKIVNFRSAGSSDRQRLAQKVCDSVRREFSRFCNPMSDPEEQSLHDT